MQKNFIKKIYDIIKQFVEKMTSNQVNVEFTLKKIFDNATSKEKINFDHYNSLQNMNSTAIILIQELNDTINQFQLNGDILDAKANANNSNQSIPNALLNAMEQSNNAMLQYQARTDNEAPNINISQLNAMNLPNLDPSILNQIMNQFKSPVPVQGMNGIGAIPSNQQQLNTLPQFQMPMPQSSQLPNRQFPMTMPSMPLHQMEMAQTIHASTQQSPSNFNNIFLDNMPYLAQNQMMNPNSNSFLTIQPGLPSLLDSNSLIQLMSQRPQNALYNNSLYQKMLIPNQSQQRAPINAFPPNQPPQNNSNINLNFMHPIHQVNAFQGIDPSILSTYPPSSFPGMVNQYNSPRSNQVTPNDNYLATLSNMLNINGGINPPSK